MWPGGPPNRVGPNPGTEQRRAKIQFSLKTISPSTVKMTTHSLLLLTNERGRPYIRRAWLGGS